LIPAGTKLIIKEPFLKLFACGNGEFGIRVETPTDVILINNDFFSQSTVSQSVDELIENGNLYFKKFDFYSSIRYYTEAFKKSNETNVRAVLNRSASYFKLERYYLAYKDAEKAAQLDDKCEKAYYRMGKAAYEMRQFEVAEKNFKNLIDTIFKLDNTLGNDFNNLNNNIDIQKNPINIYIDNYSINKNDDQKLLNNIEKINYKKHFLINKSYYDVIYIIQKFQNTEDIRSNINKYYNDIRIICSYLKGIELDVVEKSNVLDAHINEIVKNLKKNTILTKNISIYKKMKTKNIIEEINLDKLKVIQDFYNFMIKIITFKIFSIRHYFKFIILILKIVIL
jgi:tetratricopeptide (TPR) repeat protein